LLKPLDKQNRDIRRLQVVEGALAGPDLEEDQFIIGNLPMDIPTEIINLQDNNIPPKLLQAYLNNNNML
jgi:16S rRNA A1518/A1519 N6-dimethyltransferase RsmA/KsgA/DIM1 with predicted DNA glycosylase/AP lyase activity